VCRGDPAKRSRYDQRERPKAAVHVHLRMLRCGPSNRTFVHLAALCRLERRSTDKVNLRSARAYDNLRHALLIHR
jgi:hypothetical protein